MELSWNFLLLKFKQKVNQRSFMIQITWWLEWWSKYLSFDSFLLIASIKSSFEFIGNGQWLIIGKILFPRRLMKTQYICNVFTLNGPHCTVQYIINFIFYFLFLKCACTLYDVTKLLIIWKMTVWCYTEWLKLTGMNGLEFGTEWNWTEQTNIVYWIYYAGTKNSS